MSTAAVPLGETGSPAEAQRLADRLVAEGVGARARGTVVWVEAARWADATVLAGLFREVDEHRSRVAPPPGTYWTGSAGRQLLGAVVLALIVVPTVVALLLALAA